jgi:hypothetical protein
MRKKVFLLGALALLAGSTAFSQAKLVEKVTRQGDELVIPYEKYVFPNGLTVIIHEDHSDPVVHGCYLSRRLGPRRDRKVRFCPLLRAHDVSG